MVDNPAWGCLLGVEIRPHAGEGAAGAGGIEPGCSKHCQCFTEEAFKTRQSQSPSIQPRDCDY